jgi:DNA-binding NarL/FixJ family response regulator
MGNIMDKIKIFIATDDLIFQEGLSKFLLEEDDLECVARPRNGEDTVKLAKELKPDVVIMDLDMPFSNSVDSAVHAVEIARQIKQVNPNVSILMISTHGYQPGLFASLQAGVAGYLLKKTAPRELISAIRSLYSGEAVFDLDTVTRLLGNLATNEKIQAENVAQLRPREIEVLKALAGGISNKEIAEKLSISERTVQTHLVHIYRKLDVKSRTEAVLQALKEGWLKLEDLP